MGMRVNKISHSNVYIDGTVQLLGNCSECQLPKVSTEDTEHKGLGMVGTLSLPSGLKELTLSFKWNAFYPEVSRHALNAFKSVPIMIRSSLEGYDSSGRASEVPVVVQARGRWKETSGGTLKPSAAADSYDDTLTLSYIKVTVDGTELYEIDVLNNIWRVNGVDLLETMRTNLGI